MTAAGSSPSSGRVGDGRTRPLLGDDPAAVIRRLLPVRQPFYAEVADVTVDVDDQRVEAVCDEIQAALAALATPAGPQS